MTAVAGSAGVPGPPRRSASTRPAAPRGSLAWLGTLAAVGTLGALLVAGAGCASTTTSRSSPPTSTAATTGSAPSPTTATPAATTPPAGGDLATTVFDCGAAAYRPTTLLVSCRDVSIPASTAEVTTVTGVTWSAWTATSAMGAGVARYQAAGSSAAGDVAAPARVALSGVVSTPQGPQFSVLTVQWTGSSPDGHRSDRYTLTTAAARS